MKVDRKAALACCATLLMIGCGTSTPLTTAQLTDMRKGWHEFEFPVNHLVVAFPTHVPMFIQEVEQGKAGPIGIQSASCRASNGGEDFLFAIVQDFGENEVDFDFEPALRRMHDLSGAQVASRTPIE